MALDGGEGHQVGAAPPGEGLLVPGDGRVELLVLGGGQLEEAGLAGDALGAEHRAVQAGGEGDALGAEQYHPDVPGQLAAEGGEGAPHRGGLRVAPRGLTEGDDGEVAVELQANAVLLPARGLRIGGGSGHAGTSGGEGAWLPESNKTDGAAAGAHRRSSCGDR